MDINVGRQFTHLKNNGSTICKIYTKKFGFIPNDKMAQNIAWREGFYCSNGMNDCMTREQFQVYWANIMEKKFENYKKSTINKSKSV